MSGLSFYMGIGFSVLGLIYTLMVMFVRDDTLGRHRRPYLLNGIALCVLGFSLVGRELFLPAWFVYTLWAIAGYLALRATRMVMAARSR